MAAADALTRFMYMTQRISMADSSSQELPHVGICAQVIAVSQTPKAKAAVSAGADNWGQVGLTLLPQLNNRILSSLTLNPNNPAEPAKHRQRMAMS